MKTATLMLILFLWALVPAAAPARDTVVVVPLATCPDSLTVCAGRCLDTSHDPENCGACGNRCPTGSLCDQGACKELAGAAGTPCTTHGQCFSGKCVGNLCAAPARFVFATNEVYDGNLGGITGADAICQTLADSAGLPGTYKAWLSDGDPAGAPASRFTHSPVPYILPDGTRVADNWADLTDNTILHPINKLSSGQPQDNTYISIWTNTNPDGTRDSATYHCNGWTSNSPTISGAVGSSGTIGHTDNRWTKGSKMPCENKSGGLYCFEQ